MSEIIFIADWAIKALQLLVVGFLLYKFKENRLNLLFGGKKSLKNIDDHELQKAV
ncbi:hypothetical protein [Pseudoalteromonas sp. S16_S37]|uniref:hypothetical protein n=1 Tax=Pseudoalteromonas sp. S16_S37 TaxID=2720228 RepID=UPI00167FFE88|nr:hypothetical protein [Pseudoalteromonas sp. S16_S37]MBD1582772.1 hypothetical protein [Pseudoalteromonas sp. S16_S37]